MAEPEKRPSDADARPPLGVRQWPAWAGIGLAWLAARLPWTLQRPLGRGIGAGAFLAFMASFDNVPVSLFLADERTEMLPIHLWQQIDTNLDVRTAAISGVIVIATAPCFAQSACTSGRETIFVISAFSRATISGGVLFGAIRPSQITAS